GQAVGGALAAYALALGGYKSGAVQTPDAVFGIQLAAGALPAVMTILAVLVMVKYTLTDAMHARILTEIRARRTDGDGTSNATGTSDGAGVAATVSVSVDAASAPRN
ncbi:MFS transporter, partial [Streptomyces sp. NPDC002082]|uniref:MFS transporter n=1 Tax=Streptomyces sp. NPDC002082 TaxID=3154772 RepID=UPI003324CE70